MQKDLVEDRRWITKQDYVEGIALAQLARVRSPQLPSTWVGEGGVLGATLVAAFVLPLFLMVPGLRRLRPFRRDRVMQGAFTASARRSSRSSRAAS